MSASASEVNNATANGDGKRSEKCAGYSRNGDQRQKHNNRRDCRPDQRNANFTNALRIASGRLCPASRCSTIFSTTTMASSITSPTAAARPPSVIRLKLSPKHT